VRDVELQARLVHEGVDVTLGAWPHGVDAEVHDALLCQPHGCSHVDPGVVGRIGRLGKGARMMTGAEKHRAALRDGQAGFLHGRF
jgi:hypothetical protein